MKRYFKDDLICHRISQELLSFNFNSCRILILILRFIWLNPTINQKINSGKTKLRLLTVCYSSKCQPTYIIYIGIFNVNLYHIY